MAQATGEQGTSSVEALVASMDRVGSVACVGLDPVLDRMPTEVLIGDPLDSIRRFSFEVIDAITGVAACVKVQSACYERYGPGGVSIIDDICDEAAARMLPVILDAKRGDIGVSALHYAAAAFGRPSPPHWLTVNGYLGMETIEPYLDSGGVFVLVRTSNPGSGEFQSLRLEDGRTVADAMADQVAALAATRVGPSGWSDVGAVVGATHPGEAEALRARMPGVIFLVPGIGAQGGSVSDCRGLFGDDGHGALLTASRSVIYADAATGEDWKAAVRSAAERLADETGRGAGLR